MVGSLPHSLQTLLDEAVKEFQRLVAEDANVDREAYIGRYPEIAAELRRYLTDFDSVGNTIDAPSLSTSTGCDIESRDDLATQALPGESSARHAPRGKARRAPAIDGYEIQDFIDEGGMGEVWRALERSTLGREVALKVISPEKVGSKQSQELLANEVKLAASLDHPGIVKIWGSGLHHGDYYYAMEFVKGKPLDEHVEDAACTIPEIADLFVQICNAIHYAHTREFSHAKGIVHRDLKPSNIFVCGDGTIRILDFGLAQRYGESADTSDASSSGSFVGTPAYMSPEQAMRRKVDARSDVYSLGVTLYRVLTGGEPFRGTIGAIVRQILHDQPPPPRKLNPGVHPDLEAICLKAMSKEPSQRYTSAAAMAHDFRAILAGEPPASRVVSITQRVKSWASKLHWIRIAGLATTGVGVAFLFLHLLVLVVSISAMGFARDVFDTTPMRGKVQFFAMLGYIAFIDLPVIAVGRGITTHRRNQIVLALLVFFLVLVLAILFIAVPEAYPLEFHRNPEEIRDHWFIVFALILPLFACQLMAWGAFRANRQLIEWRREHRGL